MPEQKPPAPADLQFGQLAMQLGFVTKEQVAQSLALQRKMRQQGQRLPLGEILFRKGHLTQEQFREVFQEQGRQVVSIGDYRLIAKLGEGGMGSVYKARQVSMDRLVALKVLSRRCSQDGEFIKRFIREAQTSGQLSHPNLVAGIDVGSDKGIYYFAMEFVEGVNVKSIIRTQKAPIKETAALSIVKKTADALGYALQHKIIHRDVKPENILVGANNLVKLADMGLAKFTGRKKEGDTEITEKGILIGTPSYMSPEQIDNSSIPDHRSDIYALGATLYFMVTGRPPFVAQSSPGILAAHLTEKPLLANQRNPKLSSGIGALIDRMLAKKPDMRYQGYEELMQDMDKVMEGEGPGRAPRLTSSGRLMSVTARRRRGRTSRLSRMRRRNARRRNGP